MDRTHAIVLPRLSRSGATARNPSLASQSAYRRTSSLPLTSWITTIPGHGPAVSRGDEVGSELAPRCADVARAIELRPASHRAAAERRGD